MQRTHRPSAATTRAGSRPSGSRLRPSLPRSLRSRLIALLALLAAAAVAAGFVMFALFQQSTMAQIGQAAAMSGRACDSIARAYRFYTAGAQGAPLNVADPRTQRDLTAVVFTALRDRARIEGGLWQTDVGAFAYAFPSYEGGGPKTDVPQAELSRIAALNRAALADDRPQMSKIDSRSETLLIAACPLSGPVAGLSGWTMTRVHNFGGRTYWHLMAGLTILIGAVLGASAMASALIMTWARHVRRIEAALIVPDGHLPVLEPTGERELDQIVDSLNEAGERLAVSRTNAERLSAAVAKAERLAAVGRVAAGVAHEIRTPIAAMRLKAEMALSRSVERKDQALQVVIEQVDRLDGLITRILAVTEREPLRVRTVEIAAFLAACVASSRTAAASANVALEVHARVGAARFDPDQIGRAVGHLVVNALEAGPAGPVVIAAERLGAHFVVAVSDTGPGPPEAIRDTLFDPFVSGRPEGAGLGLSIVREIAEAHDGTVDFSHVDGETIFRIVIPWQDS